MCRRLAALRATRSRPSWRWATCSTASALAAMPTTRRGARPSRRAMSRIVSRSASTTSTTNRRSSTPRCRPRSIWGTKITIEWPTEARLLECAESDFKRLAQSYVWFNPHLTLRGVWHGHEFVNVAATDPNWEKWQPRNPTSPHWYDESRLQRYLAAHVARDRD